MQDLSAEKKRCEGYESILVGIDDLQSGLDLLLEMPDDEAFLKEILDQAKALEKTLKQQELQCYLSGPYDNFPCILSLTAGAGGTDAQDWADMLLRMYLRYCEKKGFSVDVLEETAGDEAGIKSVTLKVKGAYVYGFLKHEIGVHRLVRISPFNANSKRQTSFAALDVMPQLKQAALEIDPKD
eukprot:COSAG02_NODE_11751_length_1662_cov_0.818938_2_plen_182_part_01